MKPGPAARTFLLALAVALCCAPSSFAGISLSVSFGPPALPVYEQPLCPGEGYIWTPGYWAWGDDDYFWVPGTWVLAPQPGFLWTPGYWGWGGEAYVFHPGYWGVTVGFYGGINYGFGYVGHGYEGGHWDHEHFYYNRSVTRVDETVVRNVYTRNVVDDGRMSRVSYNGGNGGVEARATDEEMAAERGRRLQPIPEQTRHEEAARGNRQLRASENQGRPPVAATQRPNEFTGRSVVAAKEAGAPYHPAPRSQSIGAASGTPGHVKDVPPPVRSAPPKTGNPALDQKYQQQQQRLFSKQDQQRQQLQAKQEADHQRLAQRQATETQKQKVEQTHTRQTQKLVQRHTQQQQHLQAKQQPKQQPKQRGH